MSMREADLHYYTYEEWLALDDPRPSELLYGRILMMSSPSIRHEEVLSNLFGRLFVFLDGRACRVYPPTTGVRLFADEDTVLKPDLSVVCDKSKRSSRVIVGAPDLVVEILSPSTANHDRMVKKQEYLRAEVPELWIVDPAKRRIILHTLNGTLYDQTEYSGSDTIISTVLPGFSVELDSVFEE